MTAHNQLAVLKHFTLGNQSLRNERLNFGFRLLTNHAGYLFGRLADGSRLLVLGVLKHTFLTYKLVNVLVLVSDILHAEGARVIGNLPYQLHLVVSILLGLKSGNLRHLLPVLLKLLVTHTRNLLAPVQF